MAGIKLEGFQGLVPRASDRLLPPMAASQARNTKLLNGEIRGYRTPVEAADFTAGSVTPVRRAFRVRDQAGVNPDSWLTFDTRDVDIVRSPIINDSYDRYYWAGDGVPMMNTYARIDNGDDPYRLGVPTPINAPSVSPPAGSDETRAYVYTFVTSLGEEGPPSPPTVVTGDAGTWNLSNIDTTVSNQSERAFGAGAKVRIYRTVVGQNSASYFYVDEINFGTSTYADSETSEDVAANNLLESTTWIEPVQTMQGFVAMPNGYLVGWDGRRLLFSEPYRPHSWPAAYELSTEFPIVGLAVWGATLVICTESQPYFGQGQSPQTFTMQKLDAVEPCLSRRSIVSTPAGVYYASVNGLILCNSNGAQLLTRDILTREEWEEFNPENLYAAQLGVQYIAFDSATTGFLYDPQEPSTKLVQLDGFTAVEGIETDRYSGQVLLLQSDKANEWDAETGLRLGWNWRSKIYQTPEPVNFGAFRLQFVTGGESQAALAAELQAYNDALFAAIPSGTTTPPLEQTRGLNTLNGHVLGGVPAQGAGLVATPPQPETRQPMGGDLLFNVSLYEFSAYAVRLQVRIDGGTKVVYDRVITDTDIHRLPTGFKSDLWQFHFFGNTDMYSFQVATTPRSLKAV